MAASDVTYEEDPRGARPAVVALQVLVGTVTPLALSSIGGLGIYAAPVLLPLLWIAANACRGAGRWYFTILGSLVAALSGWAISWSLVPNLQLVLPIIAAAAVIVLFVRTWHRDLPLGITLITLVALAAFGLAGIGALAIGEQTTSREVTFERVPEN